MSGPGLRSFCTTLAPGFFSGDNAQKYLFNIGLAADGILQKLDEGIHDRMPLDADESALQYIGADRGVLRGLTESAASYRLRLQRALDDYQHAGNAWAVLAQVLGYLLAFSPAARTVSTSYTSTGSPDHTMWQYYAAGTALTLPPRYARTDPGEWNWDEFSPTTGSWGWWRWYLVLDAVAPQAWTTPNTWTIGDATPLIGDTTESVGLACSSLVIDSIRLIVAQWKSAVCHWIVVVFDGAEFRPGAGVLPDGYYGHGWKVVARHHVASRSANARYCYFGA